LKNRGGREKWIALTDKYCFKCITIFAGCATSLQYHNFKEETNFIHSGKARVTFGGADGKYSIAEVGPGYIMHVKPKEVHRIEAVTEVLLYETSTIEVDDVIRLEDSYGREGTSTP